MTREEFKNIIKAIRGAYINSLISTQQVFDEWYMLLGDLSYSDVSHNLQKHIKTNKFHPTIAELRSNSSGFNNFTGRNYDMKKLELALLGINTYTGIEEVKK